ncbi:hypothetical protein BGZ46_004781 [Entomortierella lignicola]|nr:hypothetical protein BGZ46_004781 [Entomortierella lignicola]
MLSALQHPSISNAASDNSSRVESCFQKKAKFNPNRSHGYQDEDNARNGMGPMSSYEAHDIEYNIDDTPIHPLASHPSSKFQLQGSPTSSSITSFQPQQPQQFMEQKSEHVYHAASQQPSTPDIIMTREDTERAHLDQDQFSSSPVISQGEQAEEESQKGLIHRSPHHEKGQLVVDTSSSAVPPRPIASPMSSSTPTTGYLTQDSGATAPPSRRPSLRTMTATLPRSPLQVETIALFKQYKNLIQCAKCSSRNTIQRDGMSDGNLRFKCRPPVSMSITCGKSYSESKIRNMIAGVVYGYVPDSGTSPSANGSSENVLAMAPPPSAKSARRQSRKNEDPTISTERIQQLREGQEREQLHGEFGHESPMNLELQKSYEEMSINGDHPYPVDDRRSPHDRTQGYTNRRSSEQPQYRRASIVGGESMTIDYDDSSMLPPSNHLQLPGTPPLENDDLRSYPPHATYGGRPIAPSRSFNSLNSATRKGDKKLQHSHSHPNIGQQFLDQQDMQQREHRGSIGAQGYPLYQQPHLQRQVLRRESAQYHGSIQVRSENLERRFSHPAALQSSGHEFEHQATGKPNTPQLGSLQGSGGQYYETVSSAPQYQRRMSQPYANDQRTYNKLPPPPPGSHHYERRVSETEVFNYQHREKHEKFNGSAMRKSDNKMPVSPFSLTSHNDGSMPNALHTIRDSQQENNEGHRHAYPRHYEPSNYYQQPRRDDMDPLDPHQHEALSSEETEYHSYSRIRDEYKRGNPGHSLTRANSHPDLYGASLSNSKDLMPRNSIKLTCFPNVTSPTNLTGKPPMSTDLDSSDAVAVKLSQSSKVIIEITQPHNLQAFKPSRSSSFSAFEDVPDPLNHQTQRTLRHTVSQPNLLSRSSNSVLGRRRSVSPDGHDFGSSKKRRADSVISSPHGDEDSMSGMNSSTAAAEAAAAAVVAAAASAARQQSSTPRLNNAVSPSEGPQILGMDCTEDERYETSKEIGLGVQVPSTHGERKGHEHALEPANIEALGVARASSFVPLDEQKELGIDYSLFTRVETAAWRILIPPNVVASFRSEDFGLTLKPKLDSLAIEADVANLSLGRDDNDDKIESVTGVELSEMKNTEAMSYDEEMTADDGAMPDVNDHQSEAVNNSREAVNEIPSSKGAIETEKDELASE